MSASGSNANTSLRQAAATFRDHLTNIFRLLIKELRSIRADPMMLVLILYAFSISVNTVASGAVTEATQSVGWYRGR